MSHDHSHTSLDVPPPAALRGRQALIALVVALVIATLAGVVLLRPPPLELPDEARTGSERIRGTISAVEQVRCGGPALPGLDFEEELEDAGSGPPPECTELTIRIDEGPEAGGTFTTTSGGRDFRQVGRGVVLLRGTDPTLPPEARYQLTDVQRGKPLLALAGIFLLAILALGRFRGALSVVGLGISLLILVKFLVPALIAGRPPLLTAVVGASAVMIVVLLLAHGPSIRTATAMVGTGTALLLTVLLSTTFTQLAGLSGVTSDEAAYVEAIFGGAVDLRGLLLAGFVIGTLGVLDDLTVTQVSTVYELRAADPTMPRARLYAAALRVGRDHIGSLVNTLLLAYAGASMPLLVLFATAGTGFVDTVTNGVLAEEIVRTLVGSIGLIAAVPITTGLAAVMCPPHTDGVAANGQGPPEQPGQAPTAADPTVAAPQRSARFFDDSAWTARAGREQVDPDD